MFIRSKRFISSLLCLALVFSLLGTFGLGSVQAEAGIEGYTPAMTMSELKASGADAAAGSAYSISSMDELYDLAEYINSGKPSEGVTFYITGDIKLRNCSGDNKNDRLWVPIGTESAPFSGIFDGCGYAVLNFDAVSAGDNFGLFGCVSGEAAVIKNLGIEGEVTGGDNIGAIVSVLTGGKVLNSWSAVDLNGGDVVGGIVGSVVGAVILSLLKKEYVEE